MVLETGQLKKSSILSLTTTCSFPHCCLTLDTLGLILLQVIKVGLPGSPPGRQAERMVQSSRHDTGFLTQVEQRPAPGLPSHLLLYLVQISHFEGGDFFSSSTLPPD